MNMVGWQTTETTIYCDAVDDEVTIVVYKDWSVKCTGYEKYGESSGDKTNLLKKRSRQLKRQLKCVGVECDRVVQYKGKLFSQEAGKVCSK
ncbi:hypothetical protein ACFLVV_00865 [Chloroflexota bacterium]|jgi:hypothetical protein